MVDITNSLVALAKRQGVHFHFNEKVTKIISNQKKVNGFLLNKGVYGAQQYQKASPLKYLLFL